MGNEWNYPPPPRRGRFAKGNYHSDHEIELHNGSTGFLRCTCGWTFGEGGNSETSLKAFQEHCERMQGAKP